ncbi:DMT family transporter [Cereibacter sediminicola]|uniref:DMT family transporter n=1 Tax=Cereibacter sediminicola TaxID=2584941 RepID=UPI0011A3DB0C|nr:DMT family transporter [Cereibacter sediminicola]
MAKSNTRGAFLALLAFAIYATHDVVVKLLGRDYSAVQILFFATLLGFPLATIILMRDRVSGNLRPRHPWWVLLRTGCIVTTALCAFYAFSVLPLAQTYAILFTMPLLVTLLAIPLLGETIGLHRGCAIAAGLFGVLIVLRPGAEPLSLGHGAALLAAATSSLGSVIVRKIGQDERSVVLLLYPMVANFFVLGLALPFVYRPMPIEHLGMMGIIAAFSLVAMLLTIAAYRMAEAVIVAPMQYSQMIWAAIFGWLVFGERADAWTWLGAAVIIASGLYIVGREARRNVSEHRPASQTRLRPEVGLMPRLLRRRDTRDGA